MIRSHSTLAQALLFLFACTWPWDVLQYVPWLGIHLTTVLAAAIVLVWVLDVAGGQRMRVPFELAWPPVALIALVWMDAGALPMRTTLILLLFGATIHFARTRAAIEHWLLASALMIGCTAALTLWAYAGGPVPAGYLPHTRAVLTASANLSDGILALAAGLGVAGWATTQARFPLGTRLLAACAALSTGGAFILFVYHGWPVLAGWQPPLRDGLPRLTLASLLIGLWLAARAAAKVEVSRKESARGLHVLLLSLIAMAVALWLYTPYPPQFAHALLLGLACAYTLREREMPAPSKWQWAGVPVMLALVAVNVQHVFPTNGHDPRNYEGTVRAAYEAGRYDELRARMSHFERYRSEERRSRFWRARANLEEGRVQRAAIEFMAAVRPLEDWERPLLPPPDDEERADFLVRIRDACAVLPADETGLAYERALLSADERAGALASLRLRVAYFPREGLDVDGRPLAECLAFLLGDTAFAGALEEFSPAQLALLLGECGADIVQAPADLPPEELPAVLAAYAAPSGLYVHARLGTSLYTATAAWDPKAHDALGALTWQVTGDRAQLREAERPDSPALAELGLGGTREVFARSQGRWTDETPSKPAVLVWIP